MATSACQDSICVEAEESSSTVAVSTQDDEAMILPAASRLRMHRSAVRPFFCCGSELSLVSINDQAELSCQDKATVTSSCPETECLHSNGLGACAEVLLPSHSDEGISPEGKSTRDRPLRKKSVEGFSRKMARKSWAVKLRGKLPKRLKNAEDHGNLAASGSGMEVGCMCTAYRHTDGEPVLYCYGAASSDSAPIPASLGGLDTDHPTKSKGTKGKGRAKAKPPNSANQSGVSASSLFKAWIGVDTSDAESVDGMSLVQCKEQGAVDRSRKLNLESKNLLYSCNGGALFTPAFQKQCTISSPWSQPVGSGVEESSADTPDEESQYSEVASLGPRAPYVSLHSHSQVDYVHCLVPDLACIANCSFYWGVMDRYEAEKLLENKPEGTFLLRDSAQDEFLFSVSFRRYGRSLHARVEQFNHKFSFDSHDPGVFATDTVCGLIEHYKDPSCCMFFEPMLTLPLNRSFPFSLQHLCRSTIVSASTYDGITQLPLPSSLQSYLRYYHYKHKVRVRSLET